MPKLNARKNTRNRSQAAKRERTRALNASLQHAGRVRKTCGKGQ